MSRHTPAEMSEVVIEARELGQLEAMLDEPEYVLIAYQVYPTGATAEDFVEDPVVAKAIGDKMGLGLPTDPQGWGIWHVGRAGV